MAGEKTIGIKIRASMDDSASLKSIADSTKKIEEKMKDKPIKVRVSLDEKKLKKAKVTYFKELADIQKQVKAKFSGMGEVSTSIIQDGKKRIRAVTASVRISANEVEKYTFKLKKIRTEAKKTALAFVGTKQVDTEKLQAGRRKDIALRDKERAKALKHIDVEQAKLLRFINVEIAERKKILAVMDRGHIQALKYMDEEKAKADRLKTDRRAPSKDAHLLAIREDEKVNQQRLKTAHQQALSIEKRMELRRKEHLEALRMNTEYHTRNRKSSKDSHSEAVRMNTQFNQKQRGQAERLADFKRQMESRVTSLRSGAGKFMTKEQSRSLLAFENDMDKFSPKASRMTQELRGMRTQFRGLNANIQSTARNSLKLGQSLKQAFTKFPIWIATAGLVMGVLNTFRASVTYIKEMDKALTDLSKVVDFTNKELVDMKDSAIDLGRELGRSSIDIMRAFAEFGRVRKVREEIEALSRAAILASNVTTLTAESSAKAINTAMIAFKLEAKDSMRIVDEWNELQNNFRVSAEDMAEAIGAVGPVARQAGVEIQQLNAYVASMAGATGLGGSEIGTA